MTEIDPEALAESASKPGTFSFIDRLLGRNYPTAKVKLYLDEQAAFERQRLVLESEGFKVRNKEANVELVEQIEELDRKLNENKYVIVLQGFPPEEYDELIKEVEEQFPVEYEVTVNLFSGGKTKDGKDNQNYLSSLSEALG